MLRDDKGMNLGGIEVEADCHLGQDEEYNQGSVFHVMNLLMVIWVRSMCFLVKSGSMSKTTSPTV